MMTDEGQVAAKKKPARVEPRHRIDTGEAAVVEFDYPQPLGRRRRLTLHDMSTGGICFTLPFHGLSGIDPATHILDVVVRIGRCEIAGELLVSHKTRVSNERVRCGGRFYPSTESDHLQLVKAIASLESRQET